MIFSVNRGFVPGCSHNWNGEMLKSYSGMSITAGTFDILYYSSHVVWLGVHDTIFKRSISSRGPACQAFAVGMTDGRK